MGGHIIDDLIELDDRLHGYQIRAVEHLWEKPRAALYLDMGLGKSAICLQALKPEHLPALIVSTKRAAENSWPHEFDIWRPDLKYKVAVGSPARRAEVLNSDVDAVIVGRDLLHSVRMELGKDHRFKTVILDELSSFKTPSSKRFKAARVLCFNAENVWGLTGTPAPQGYPDLWAQVFLLDKGKRLGRTVGEFRSRFLTPGYRVAGGQVATWNLRHGAKKEIDDLISDICLSMTAKDYLSLPDRMDNRVEVELPPKARKIYESMKKELVATVSNEDYSARDSAHALGRLQQISAGFLYPDPEESTPEDVPVDIHKAKVDTVAEIVESSSTPVLVLYSFQRERDMLVSAIPGAKTPTDSGAIEDFAKGSLHCLVAHPASVGHGLNFQRHCHTVVWSTLPWSSELFLQSNARVYRQGQEHPTVVHYVATSPGVDDIVWKSLKSKLDVQDSLVNSLKESQT